MECEVKLGWCIANLFYHLMHPRAQKKPKPHNPMENSTIPSAIESSALHNQESDSTHDFALISLMLAYFPPNNPHPTMKPRTLLISMFSLFHLTEGGISHQQCNPKVGAELT